MEVVVYVQFQLCFAKLKEQLLALWDMFVFSGVPFMFLGNIFGLLGVTVFIPGKCR